MTRRRARSPLLLTRLWRWRDCGGAWETRVHGDYRTRYPRATRRNHTPDGTRSYAESAPRHDASVSYLYLYCCYYYSYVCCFIQGIARAVTSRCVERFVVCMCVGGTPHRRACAPRRCSAVYGENAVGKKQVSCTRVRTRKHAHYT